MIESFLLPDLGEGVHEAEILAVLVTSGQAIKEGDVIFEIETDKAAVEIPSPTTGTVAEIKVAAGDIAKVGDILVTFTTLATEPSEPSKPRKKSESTATSEKTQESPHNSKLPVPASPATRRLAREHKVDLRQVVPSAASGVVSQEDVLKFAEQRNASPSTTQPESVSQQESLPVPEPMVSPKIVDTLAPLPDFAKWGEIQREPFRSVRRATATHMATSWAQIPHVHCQDTVDITKLETFRQKHKDEIAADGGRLTLTVFALKAVTSALKTFPYFNSSLDLTTQEIILKNYFHIGIAMDTERGLMVPVIRDVDRKSVKELAIEIKSTIARVRENKQSREEMAGGTFTITNVGSLGGNVFSAIINHPQVAIFGLGQARMQPAVRTDQDGKHRIVPRLLVPIVLCFDHRVVDGADAIRFLKLVIDGLEDPDELLMTMV